MNCPGTNYDYKLGTFYALQTDSGLYLSHPGHYRNGTGERVFDYLKYFNGNGAEKAHITMNCALTEKWWCAWITYSLEDLRQVYQYIRSQFESELRSKRAKYPCVGAFSKGKYGMLSAQLHRMTDTEIADSKVTQVHTTIKTAGQLKLQLTKSYPRVGLLQGVLPDISEKTSQKVNTDAQKRKKQVHSKHSDIPGGLFGYTLPKN